MLSIGVMVLEKQLLAAANSAGSQAPPAKKSRGAAKPLPEDPAVWGELSKWVES